jgi:hypothetical protein
MMTPVVRVRNEQQPNKQEICQYQWLNCCLLHCGHGWVLAKSVVGQQPGLPAFFYITVDWCDAARILLPIKRGAEANALLGVRYIQARPGLKVPHSVIRLSRYVFFKPPAHGSICGNCVLQLRDAFDWVMRPFVGQDHARSASVPVLKGCWQPIACRLPQRCQCEGGRRSYTGPPAEAPWGACL